MNKRMIIACVALVCCATLALGCNKGPKKVHITGTVTVNGETVDQGAITFIAKDGSGLKDGGKIVDGAFEADVTTGEKTVQVYGSKKTGNKVKPDPTLNPDLEVDEVKDFPPATFKEEKTVNIEKKGQVVDVSYGGAAE